MTRFRRLFGAIAARFRFLDTPSWASPPPEVQQAPPNTAVITIPSGRTLPGAAGRRVRGGNGSR